MWRWAERSEFTRKPRDPPGSNRISGTGYIPGGSLMLRRDMAWIWLHLRALPRPLGGCLRRRLLGLGGRCRQEVDSRQAGLTARAARARRLTLIPSGAAVIAAALGVLAVRAPGWPGGAPPGPSGRPSSGTTINTSNTPARVGIFASGTANGRGWRPAPGHPADPPPPVPPRGAPARPKCRLPAPRL